MATVTILFETYGRLKESERLLLALKKQIPEDEYNKYLVDIRRERKAEEFIEDLHDVLTEASIDYPAGRDSYPRIDFDEEFVKGLIIKMLEDVDE